MQIGSSEVTGEKRHLGEAKFPIFETWEEVCNHPEYGLGEEKGLDLLNAQVKTNAMNQLRASKTKGPTKSLLRTEAMTEIVSEITSGNHAEVIGNSMAINALVERRMKEIEQRMKAADEAANVGAGTEDDEDDEG